MLRRIGAGTLGILEHEGRVVTNGAHQGQRLLVIFFSFAMIAHEHIGRNAAIGNDAANGIDAIHVPFNGVFAVHQLQYLIAAALHRQVNVLANIRLFSNHAQRIVAHVLRMRRGKANAYAGNFVCHTAQELWKINGFCRNCFACCRQMFGNGKTIGVDVLPQQRNFLVVLVAQVTHLTQDTLHVSRPFSTSCVGYDAVVAEVVASPHDTYETSYLAYEKPLRNHILIGFGLREFYIDCFVARFSLRNHVGKVQIRIGSTHQVGVMVVQQIVFHPFGHTAQHA